MAIHQDNRNKCKVTGAHPKKFGKHRAAQSGRPPAATKIGITRKVRKIRTRGGNAKYRALRLHKASFSWPEYNVSCASTISKVVYNPAGPALQRNQTLTCGAIVEIDAAPFKAWYRTHFNKELDPAQFEGGLAEIGAHELSAGLNKGKLLARITSRPGQCGTADGYVLYSEELAFYTKKCH